MNGITRVPIAVMAKPRIFQAACIQVNAGKDWQANIDRITRKLIPEALQSKPDLIALPEMFLYRGRSGQLSQLAQTASEQILSELQKIAKLNRVGILAGSLPEASRIKAKYYNSSYFIDEKGKILSKYRKVHLFDIDLPGKVSLKESRHVLPGKSAVSFKWKGIHWGQSICYDLRFAEYYRCLAAAGCRVIFVPANFTYETGKAHWETLLKARAIENQLFIVAPNQGGSNSETGVKSFGRTMIISPWGDILAQTGRSQGEQIVVAKLDLARQDDLRRQFPVLKHRKL